MNLNKIKKDYSYNDIKKQTEIDDYLRLCDEKNKIKNNNNYDSYNNITTIYNGNSMVHTIYSSNSSLIESIIK